MRVKIEGGLVAKRLAPRPRRAVFRPPRMGYLYHDIIITTIVNDGKNHLFRVKRSLQRHAYGVTKVSDTEHD